MVYTIRSATWGNEDKTSAVVVTDEVAAVAISAVDTPEEWKNFQVWIKTNSVTDLPVVTKPTTKQQIEKRLGMTLAEFKALLNG